MCELFVHIQLANLKLLVTVLAPCIYYPLFDAGKLTFLFSVIIFPLQHSFKIVGTSYLTESDKVDTAGHVQRLQGIYLSRLNW